MIIEIFLDTSATDSEINAVVEAARTEGIRGSVQAVVERRGLGELPWLVVLSAPISVFVSAFFAAAGNDAYGGLRRLVSRLFRARRNSNGCVELEDNDSGTYIILTDDLPVEAYQHLAKIGLERLKGGYWVWESEHHKWKRW